LRGAVTQGTGDIVITNNGSTVPTMIDTTQIKIQIINVIGSHNRNRTRMFDLLRTGGLASSSARRRTEDADVPGRFFAPDPFGRRSAAYRAAGNGHSFTFSVGAHGTRIGFLCGSCACGNSFRIALCHDAISYKLAAARCLPFIPQRFRR
jgi:hypothetical protein